MIAEIPCGNTIVLNLGASAIPIAGGDPDWDLVYYEMLSGPSQIYMDMVVVEVSINGTGGWVQVFNWGDNVLDANTSVGQAGYGASGEPDNTTIPFTALYNGNSTGVAIDLDAVAPPGTYRFVRIYSPTGGANDPSEVDAVQPLP